MRRMLDPKEVGGSLPSTIKFDEEGNRTVGKDLGVDGKLKLKSLVSASNPDGDITKELGGGGGTTNTLYQHSISLYGTNNTIYLVLYSYVPDAFNFPKIKSRLKNYISCSGYVKIDNTYCNVAAITYGSNKFYVEYINPTSGFTSTSVSITDMNDHPSKVE